MRRLILLFMIVFMACSGSNAVIRQIPVTPEIVATETATAEPALTATPEPTNTILTCRVTADFLNVRSGPGVEYAGIGSLNSGDVVTVTEIIKFNNTESSRSDWLKIPAGFINSLYCQWR